MQETDYRVGRGFVRGGAADSKPMPAGSVAFPLAKLASVENVEHDDPGHHADQRHGAHRRLTRIPEEKGASDDYRHCDAGADPDIAIAHGSPA